MNSKIPDDLVSAFHDRELTPAEEVAASLQIRQSPEAKRELESYQRMSDLLGALPRQSVPTEFASAVMQRAERETLIPLDDRVAVPASQSRFGWLRRRSVHYAAAGTLAVAAVAVVVLVVVLPSREKGLPVAQNEATATRDFDLLRERRAESFAVATKRADGRDESSSFYLDKPKSLDVAHTSSAAKSGPSFGEAGERKDLLKEQLGVGVSQGVAVRQGVAGKMGLAKQEGPGDKAKASNSPSEISDGLELPYRPPASAPSSQTAVLTDAPQMVFPADLKKVKVGDVVEALEQNSEQVAVVRLTVVDRSNGVGGSESLFVRDATRAAKNERESEELRERIRTLKKAGAVAVKGMPAHAGAGDLVCVFVEGTRDELVTVLEELQKESTIQTARLTNTISAAQLTQFSKGRVVPSDRKTGQNSPRSQQVVSLPSSAVDQIVANQRPAKSARRWGFARPPIAKGAMQSNLGKDADPKATLEYLFDQTSKRSLSATPRQRGRSQSQAQAGAGFTQSKAASNVKGEADQSTDGLTTNNNGIGPEADRQASMSGGDRARRGQQKVAATRRFYQAFFVLDDKKEEPPAPQSLGRQPVVAPRPQAKRAF